MPRPRKAGDFDGDLAAFLGVYNYQPLLTPRLDRLEGIEFTQELVNQIVLWKVDRFVQLKDVHLNGIEGVRRLKPGEHRQAESVLASLLDVRGVDLPMASTLLRFRNPAVFQIIDRHAYRAIFGTNFPKTTVIPKKIHFYFHYLDELLKLCDRKRLDFTTADRVLYEFDRQTNGALKGEPALE